MKNLSSFTHTLLHDSASAYACTFAVAHTHTLEIYLHSHSANVFILQSEKANQMKYFHPRIYLWYSSLSRRIMSYSAIIPVRSDHCTWMCVCVCACGRVTASLNYYERATMWISPNRKYLCYSYLEYNILRMCISLSWVTCERPRFWRIYGMYIVYVWYVCVPHPWRQNIEIVFELIIIQARNAALWEEKFLTSNMQNRFFFFFFFVFKVVRTVCVMHAELLLLILLMPSRNGAGAGACDAGRTCEKLLLFCIIFNNKFHFI